MDNSKNTKVTENIDVFISQYINNYVPSNELITITHEGKQVRVHTLEWYAKNSILNRENRESSTSFSTIVSRWRNGDKQKDVVPLGLYIFDLWPRDLDQQLFKHEVYYAYKAALPYADELYNNNFKWIDLIRPDSPLPGERRIRQSLLTILRRIIPKKNIIQDLEDLELELNYYEQHINNTPRRTV